MIAQTKLVSVIIASSATFVSAAIPGYPTDLDRKISATITARITERDLSWITPELRPKVIARLQEGLKDQDMREWGMAGLLALEDATTITALMNQWKSSSPDERGAALDMLCHNTPTAILLPLLAQHLDDVRIYFRGGGDTPGDLEWRDIAATEMNNVIYLRNEFPAATKAWARSLGREWPKHYQIKLWWEHNKEKIEARHYAEAVWLPESTNGNLANANKAVPRVTSTVTRSEAKPPIIEADQASQSKITSKSTPWSALVALFVVAIGLLFLVIKKRK